MNNAFVVALRDSDVFRSAMREVLELRPVVPAYRPCKSAEEEQQLLARIKFEAGAVQGFDMLWAALVGVSPNGDRNGRKRADSEPSA